MIAKFPMSDTPASFMRWFASAATRASKVPLASLLAKTSNPSCLSERARNAVQTWLGLLEMCYVEKGGGVRKVHQS